MKDIRFILLGLLLFPYLSLFAKKSNAIVTGLEAEKYITKATEVHIDKQTGAPAFIRFDIHEAPKITDLTEQLKKWYQLDKNYHFELIRIDEDELGYKHHRFQQFYQGYEVKNMVVYVHAKNEKVMMINGQLETRFENTFTYTFQFLNALDIAKNHMGASAYKWDIPKEEALLSEMHHHQKKSSYFPERKLVIAPENWNINNVDNYHLCFELDMFAHQPEGRNLMYIDANDGSVILNQPLICEADILASAETKRSGKRTITTDSTIVSGYYVLSESGRGNGIVTLNSNGSHFRDEDNSWTLLEYDNAARDYSAIDAHWAAEVTYDYFLEKHNRNSFDNRGSRIQCRVHQVFQDGNTNNATWNGSYISVGDAFIFPYTFATLDIIAHEFTHGVTDNTAGLIYVQESGALNESFSDIFGAAIEFYGKPPNQGANWLIGEDTGFALRNMANPNSRFDPDTYGPNDPYWIDTEGCWPGNNNDLCGLHTNSGVQNYWFYLLTNGGNGTNHNDDTYSVQGIGIDKATKIAYRNLTTYLKPNSDYEDAKIFAIQSAIDLYGDCPPSPEVISTINAWHAVGLGEKYEASNALQPNFSTIDPLLYCSAPQTIDFKGRSSLGVNTYKWDFGDGSSSTLQNPSHTYTQPGSYAVSLEVTGCNLTNTITKNTFITIDNESDCIINMPVNSSVTETTCEGTLYDFGGPDKNYADLSEGILTITSPTNDPVTLTFTELGYEKDYDYLYIYDGSNINAPLLWRLNDAFIPPPITSSGNSITLRHFSDTYVVDKGFALTWSTSANCNVSCSDANIQIEATAQSPSCENNNDGSITTSISGGTSPYNFLWNSGETTANINNKAAGSYTLTVTDGNQCSSSSVVNINESIINLQHTIETKHETCVGKNDGAVNVTDIANGTPPYSVNWSNNGTGMVIANLIPGVYTANISDKNGCTTSGSYEVLPAAEIRVLADITPASSTTQPNGAIQLSISGGSPPYSYYWSNNTTTSLVNNLSSGGYWVSVIDVNNCQVFENYDITVEGCPNMLNNTNNNIISTGILSAGDGIVSNGKIISGNNVTLTAGTYIELINNFEVEKGGILIIDIGGCN